MALCFFYSQFTEKVPSLVYFYAAGGKRKPNRWMIAPIGLIEEYRLYAASGSIASNT